MANELNVVSEEDFTVEDREELDTAIDEIINQHKHNRQEINKLVFESVESLAEADIAQSELSNKSIFKRLLGDITGSNQKLQNKINSSKSAAQYASQQTLQKLAEQNLMSFDLITAVNNKLNASIYKTNEEFKNIYAGLNKFFEYNRGELVQIELRLNKLEQNVNLLTWQNSIEFLNLNGTPYSYLSDAGKIVCIARDFYDITKGNWSTKELLLLKAAMSQIGLQPTQSVDYLYTIKELTDTDELKSKLLGDKHIIEVGRPDIFISLGLIDKIEKLNNSEKYIVSSLRHSLSDKGVESSEKEIVDELLSNYMIENIKIHPGIQVNSYDFIVDMLFNLKTAEELHILVNKKENILISGKTFDPLQYAISLFLEHKNKEAFDIFKQLADEGNGRAAYILSLFYKYGYNTVKCDENKAKTYLDLGIKNKDILSIIKWYLDKDHDDSLMPIYEMYGSTLKELVNSNDVCVKDLYAKFLYETSSTNESIKQALIFAMDAAEQGFLGSQNRVGYIYNCFSICKNHQKALEWYQKDAEQGNAMAQNNLGNLYYNGNGVEQNYQKAAEWFKKSADQGYCQALNTLGYMFRNGIGVEQNYQKAVELFQKAVDQNDLYAINELGIMYEYGQGVEQNYQKAVELYQKAADQGNTTSQNNLGNCYYNGNGVFQDYKKAAELYQKAADHGNALGQYFLANCYYYGKGVGMCVQVSSELYSESAKNGCIEAIQYCNNYGISY